MRVFQLAVADWMRECFPTIWEDKKERNHRFLEESIELVQSCGATKEECFQLVEYVYGRKIGEKSQEVGGVLVTLAALCTAQCIDLKSAGSIELNRVWQNIDLIRAKQAAKPKNSPLPQQTAGSENATPDVETHPDRGQ